MEVKLVFCLRFEVPLHSQETLPLNYKLLCSSSTITYHLLLFRVSLPSFILVFQVIFYFLIQSLFPMPTLPILICPVSLSFPSPLWLFAYYCLNCRDVAVWGFTCRFACRLLPASAGHPTSAGQTLMWVAVLGTDVFGATCRGKSFESDSIKEMPAAWQTRAASSSGILSEPFLSEPWKHCLLRISRVLT